MPAQTRANAAEVRSVIEERLRALESLGNARETATIEWRGQSLYIPVIAMPVALLQYNPDTHRIRAQRSMDAERERELFSDPYGDSAQSYLHSLLLGDPADPSKPDPSFIALKDDLGEHGQSDPGIITREGILINGNTRRAALKELGESNIRVGVLPLDASREDLQALELSLQLRKDHKRDYSYMNFLLALDERAVAGQRALSIQEAFRIKATTYEQCRWILAFVRDAIERSRVDVDGATLLLRLVDFESHQGKLEEIYKAYMRLKSTSTDNAEALREQRLLALALDKSKTDLRLIEADFTKRYLKKLPLDADGPAVAPVRIPGTSITAPGLSTEVQALKRRTTDVLRARSVANSPGAVSPAAAQRAVQMLGELNDSIDVALDQAGRQGRLVKKRFAPSDRISDACDDLELAISAIADARGIGNFDADDLDEVLVTLRSNLYKLAAIVIRGADSSSDGVSWLRAIAKLAESRN